MKKTLAAITTAILAVGIAVAGVTGAANADSVDGTADASSTATTSIAATPAAENDSAASATDPVEPMPAVEVAPVVADAAPSVSAPAPKAAGQPAARSAVVTSVYDPYCISDPVFSYTYNGVDKGTVTATKYGTSSGKLCKPLYIRAATWSYTLPTNGANPSWPQTLFGANDVILSTLGTVSYQAPALSACKQNDIYASFDGWDALKVPSQLNGPGTPYEPQFLHGTLDKSRGPVPTYYSAPSIGCAIVEPAASLVSGECYWDTEQHQSFKSVTFVYDNSKSTIPVTFEVQSNQWADYSAYTRTVPAKSVLNVSAQASWAGGVGYTIVANGDSKHAITVNVPAYAQCPPISDAVLPVTFTDVCGTAGDMVNIPVGTLGYTYSTDDKRVDGAGTVTVTAVADADHQLPYGATTTWSHAFRTDAANKCVATEGDPTARPQVCDTDGSGSSTLGAISVVGSSHISYLIHNTDTPSRAKDVTVTDGETVLPVGAYLVTATADTGYTLTDVPATTALEITDQAVECDLPTEAAFTPSVSTTNQVCTDGNTTSGSIRIDLADGLTYFVGSRQLTAAITNFAPGTYSVRAEAPVGDTVLGENPVTVTISNATAGCAAVTELSTLAFTGVGAGSIWLLVFAAILLLLGAAALSVQRIRKSRNLS